MHLSKAPQHLLEPTRWAFPMQKGWGKRDDGEQF